MKTYILLLAFYFLLLPNMATGQIGNCEPALAEVYLDAGNVRARILNNGGLFWRGSPAVYEAPIGIGANSIFAAGIWIGGFIEDDLRMAATRYGPWEFWSGPLDDAGNPPDDCSLFDKIWEIRREDIASFLNTGDVSDNLLNWPWLLGAPVVDGDGNPDNYNLEGGDLPELLGDQRLWWIMNDRGNVHEATDSEPIGLEVHASAFAFTNPGPLGNFTFYSYRLINKNPVPFTDAYFGFFTDVDLGDFSDDYVGSDSLLHVGYAYNSDNSDAGCGVDIIPPAVGFTFLETIVADSDGLDNDRDGEVDEPGEMLGTSSVMNYYGGGGVNGDPRWASDYYNYMQGKWKNGKPLIQGGDGYEGSYNATDAPPLPTKFVFSGDPVTKSFWSEFNHDNKGSAISPADRRFVTSTGSFNITPNDTVDFRVAIVWSQGENHLDSVTMLKKDVAGVRQAGDALYTPSETIVPKPATLEPGHVLGFDQNFPNPFSQSTSIRYSLPQTMQVRLAVYDALGREVKVLVNHQQDTGTYAVEFDAGSLPSGIYLAQIELDYLRFTKRMVLVR